MYTKHVELPNLLSMLPFLISFSHDQLQLHLTTCPLQTNHRLHPKLYHVFAVILYFLPSIACFMLKVALHHLTDKQSQNHYIFPHGKDSVIPWLSDDVVQPVIESENNGALQYRCHIQTKRCLISCFKHTH